MNPDFPWNWIALLVGVQAGLIALFIGIRAGGGAFDRRSPGTAGLHHATLSP